MAEAPDAPIRFFVAPSNFAGQGWQWAHAAQRHLDGVKAVAMAYHGAGEFGFPVDMSVPVSGYVFSKKWQARQREAVTAGFTHVGVEAERHPFGRVFDQSVETQVRQLLDAGVKVAFLSHGTDIRLPSRHAAMEEYSPYKDGLWPFTERAELESGDNLAMIARLEIPVFVSTPDLLVDVPHASWLPVIVEPEKWRSATQPLHRGRPVVVHAPSGAIIKGSDLVDPIMQSLHEQGIVEYVRIQGVPADEIPEIYRNADIVLDQFRLGSYGVAACESLAAGRVVIGHVSRFVRDYVREHTGTELPIVEATASTLEATIRTICADPQRYRELASAGPEFVAAVHDGRASAAVLKTFLDPESDAA
ncbi:glycosyltransferase [Leifsonia sp. Root112D2]|uniref:glycosyltransferase n=1 Tax=Leifsonia sp. Root112D2 TaxID=1736426 RepID=UPI000B0645B7|nr:glycosyltransferase [Leifsonia sp. Root112D2]